MSLQLTRRARRVALGAVLGSSFLLVGACDARTEEQIDNWAMPNSPVTAQSEHIFELWKWSWVAALITGAITWALIFYACWAYRRRNADDVPVQTRYNLPLEIFYTIAPIMMVIVFFAWTVRAQEAVLDEVENPDNCVQVVGQQWSWTFNYTGCGEGELEGPATFVSGDGSHIPTLVLEEGATTQFYLSSPDVIHSFWITGFMFKMDIMPGQEGDERNHFQITPTVAGDYVGKCTELCGAYHSRMLFNVQVLESDAYDKYIADLAKDPETYSADGPVLGGEHATTTARTEHGGHE